MLLTSGVPLDLVSDFGAYSITFFLFKRIVTELFAVNACVMFVFMLKT